MLAMLMSVEELSQALSIWECKVFCDLFYAKWGDGKQQLADAGRLHQRICEMAGTQNPAYFSWERQEDGRTYVFAMLGNPGELAAKASQRLAAMLPPFTL